MKFDLVYVLNLLIFAEYVQSTMVEMNFSDNRILRFDKFLEPCDGPRRISYFRNIIPTSEDKSKVNFEFVVTRTFSPDEIKLHYTQCPSKEALDSCRLLRTFTARTSCKMFGRPNEMYSPIFSCFTPKFTCPFQKGVYRGRNCWLDFSSFNWFPVGHVYWKNRVEMFEKKKEVSCCDSDGSAIRRL